MSFKVEFPLISVAPNGARKTKADLPQLPITPGELAQEALRCADAGAGLFHIHVRDEQQRHSLDVGRYREALVAIREAVGKRMILQISTETVGIYTPPDMIQTIHALKPEAFSVGVVELIPSSDFEQPAQEFLAWAHREGIQIQYILYSDHDVKYFSDLMTKGVIPNQSEYHVLFVLGKKTGVDAQVSDLGPFLAAHKEYLPAFITNWAICAFGPHELACCVAAASTGGCVRIGFENNHLLPNGQIAPTNAALVAEFRKEFPYAL